MHARRLPVGAAVAGLLLLAMILLSTGNGFFPVIPASYGGGLAWIAGLIMFPGFAPVLKLQIITMIVIGLSAILVTQGSSQAIPHLSEALSINHRLIAMLAAVSFLRLITQPQGEDEPVLPKGKRSLFRTLLGVHFFGAIINLSSVLIVADRLSKKKPLTMFQGLILIRGFSLAALWSPFFAAMGIALTNSPGANLFQLSCQGFPLAILGLLISILGFRRVDRQMTLEGYPWNFRSLWIPGLLAAAIISAHQIDPAISIVTLIAIFSLAITCITLLFRQPGAMPGTVYSYATQTLPRITGELSLFMAAGVLVVGISALLESRQLSLQITAFGPTEASILLSGILILAVAGIHPLISISTAGTVLLASEIDADLLGMTFLMGWGLGIAASPLSAINLIMQGRYGLPIWQMLKYNSAFVVLMLLADIAALHLYHG